MSRDDSWLRDKDFLGTGHPDADANGNEKWVRFSAEVPPELAKLLEEAQRKSLGVNASPKNATKANMVRAGLRLYLNAVMPEGPEDIEGTAIEINDLPALPSESSPFQV